MAMEIREFLAELAQDCDPAWRDQIAGIADHYTRYEALTDRQRKSVEVEARKLKRNLPDDWQSLAIREAATPGTPASTIATGNADREAMASALEDFAIAVAKIADRLRA